ncbi:amidase [Thermoactinomyces mirandus]|uniref:Amidase n=1 Tax=Thermoactinomyces mirandus TaxID=2756294 RepID=A0A7W2APV5_9BACL|nr:amidase [Thermoactinomyces mirandus]MBA4601354.1 amidase [Thermoactinomyces mirandus]
MRHVLEMDATTLARELKQGTLYIDKVLSIYRKQIEKVNPHLNVVTETTFQKARLEARQIKSGGFHGRLAGILFSIKESFHAAGTITSGGLNHLKTNRVKEDAEVVRRLKKEGAILLAKTNTPALSFCQETDNSLYGRSNNPWDLSRTPGGSSGGEGALIAAGGAAVGIGSDIGGSIRIPAHFNGVIGFKSGAHQIPDTGLFPKPAHPMQQSMLGIGALCKSVADAKLIHEILSDCPLQIQNINNFVLTIPDPSLLPRLDFPTLQLYEEIYSCLKQDFPVERSRPPLFHEAAQMWLWIMIHDGGQYMIDQTEFSHIGGVLWDYLKAKAGADSKYHPYLTWSLLGARLYKPSDKQWGHLLLNWKKAKMKVHDFLYRRILILPVYHTSALPHGQLYRELFSGRRKLCKHLSFITYANTFGLPVLTIPIGNSSNCLPIGFQLITAPGLEDALFQLGSDLETRFRGYVRCNYYDE